ncbi:hypothetical protein [Fimbriiglobus ruber]|uniref:Uncharacterized protein n=1 Tax=Fimbriiglobus ruber TaxID=1908690 RepID=A0A225E155_9BACT|nr:hypothetical protein [Fimbriiglobus ruber]OWK47322.1 hypothetical protein FRUB_01021 [Fimbriiglobus ruber]
MSLFLFGVLVVGCSVAGGVYLMKSNPSDGSGLTGLWKRLKG